mmetsp:Transcript_53310/g.141282  ORF Transcript_53310/g.141282 Transcript_53310/m.141282 type:complete len:107 (-) Transcript_53310:908-1228(-)
MLFLPWQERGRCACPFLLSMNFALLFTKHFVIRVANKSDRKLVVIQKGTVTSTSYWLCSYTLVLIGRHEENVITLSIPSWDSIRNKISKALQADQTEQSYLRYLSE